MRNAGLDETGNSDRLLLGAPKSLQMVTGVQTCALPISAVRTGHGTTDWFQIEKEYIKAVFCHPAYLTHMQGTSGETLGWRKHKLESRLLGEISITSEMQMVPLLCRK